MAEKRLSMTRSGRIRYRRPHLEMHLLLAAAFHARASRRFYNDLLNRVMHQRTESLRFIV